MKPVSLADISYSQALQMLGMRKEALDAGQVQRLPSRVLSNSYFIRDAGQEVEKRAKFDFMKTLRDAWATPTGKATAIGTGLGALGGLGKSFMDDEDDNYFGNAVTGALGGGALGLGAGLAFDSGTRNKLVNKATNYINSFGKDGPEAGGQATPSRRPSVDQAAKTQADAIPKGEMAQAQQALADTRGMDALKANANLIGNTTAAGTAGLTAARKIPGSYSMDPMERMLTNPADMDWNALAEMRRNSPTLANKIEQQMAQIPGASTEVSFRRPGSPAQNFSDAFDELNRKYDAGVNPKQLSLEAELPGLETVRGKSNPGNVSEYIEGARRGAGEVLPKGTSPQAAAAYEALLDGKATPDELRQIGKELGINPAFLSGKVQNPAALDALNRSTVAGEGLETAMKPRIGRAIAEGVEQKSLKPLVQSLKRVPKGKLAAILAAAAGGYGALRGGFGGTLNEISREGQTRKALREELRRRLSSGGN